MINSLISLKIFLAPFFGRVTAEFLVWYEKINKMYKMFAWSMEMVWCLIWKAKVSNKVKMFAWRACHNILHACANLVNRRVLTQP